MAGFSNRRKWNRAAHPEGRDSPATKWDLSTPAIDCSHHANGHAVGKYPESQPLSPERALPATCHPIEILQHNKLYHGGIRAEKWVKPESMACASGLVGSIHQTGRLMGDPSRVACSASWPITSAYWTCNAVIFKPISTACCIKQSLILISSIQIIIKPTSWS